MKIFLATKNNGKIAELEALLEKNQHDIISLNNFNITEPEENGKTFQENSIIKAVYYSKILKTSVIADDSGLCIKALNDKPGVFSARFAQEHGGYPAVFNYIESLFKKQKLQDHSAYFICNVTFLDIIKNQTYNFEGICNGKIRFPSSGKNGFGYDPIFVPDNYDNSMAELTMEEKNLISHRGLALKKLQQFLIENYE